MSVESSPFHPRQLKKKKTPVAAIEAIAATMVPTVQPEPQHAVDILEPRVAAEKLGISVRALRARCRRHARRDGRYLIAWLGPGIVAFKFGRNWRVRVDANF